MEGSFDTRALTEALATTDTETDAEIDSRGVTEKDESGVCEDES